MNKKVKKYFSQSLKKLRIIAWILSAVSIPLGLINSKISAEILISATSMNVRRTIIFGTALLVFILLKTIYGSVTGMAQSKLSKRTLQSCRMGLYDVFLSCPLSSLYSSKNGDNIEKFTTDFNTVADKHISLLPNFYINICTAIIYAIIIGKNSVIVLSLIIVISCLQVIPPMVVKKFMQTNYSKCDEIEAQISDLVVEGYHGFLTIKLYNLYDWFNRRLKALHSKYNKVGSESIYATRVEDSLKSFVGNLVNYGSIGIVGLCVLTGKLELESGLYIITLSGGLIGTFSGIFSSIPQFAIAKIAESRLEDWFEKSEGRKQYPISSASVSVCGLCYSYDENRIFRKADMDFIDKKIHVIKGPNGAGKSTLFKLFCGLIDPLDGYITLGNVKSCEIADTEFGKSFIYLPQNDSVFDFTPNDLFNMSNGNAEKAKEFAYRFDLTDELVINSKISQLSGGERKKVYLALALSIDPSILLLDEPTNSLDTESIHTLCELLKNRSGSTFITTHDVLFENELHAVSSNIVYTINDGGIYVEKQ